MNVVLMVPPLRPLTGVPIRSYPVALEDIGLGYIAAYLRHHGHQVTILDCQLQGIEVARAAQQLVEWQPDVVGISISYQNTELQTGVELINAIREAGLKQPLIVGGVTATFLHEFLMERCPGLDMVCLGEGEETMLDLVQRLERGDGWYSVSGIAYRGSSGVVRTSPRPPIADLDRMPFVARDLLLLQLDQGVTREGKRSAAMESSRGCPYRCTYCAVPSFYDYNVPGKRWRPKGIDHVLDEMEMLEKQWGVEVVGFVDDNFVGPGERGRDRALTFAREYLRRRVGVNYSFWCRADTVEEDLFRRLKEAGLCGVSLGIETGSQAVLDRYQKRATVGDNRRALEILTRLDIPITTSFILFDPYTTLEDLSETIHFCLETGAHRMMERPTAINVLVPFPGTPIRETIIKDVKLTALAADPSFAESTIFWQYECLDPDVEMVRGTLFKVASLIQQRINSWLRLQDAIRTTTDRLERGLCSGKEDVAGIQEALTELKHEYADKWQPWYHNIMDFLWTNYAEVVKTTIDAPGSPKAPHAKAVDWRVRFQGALAEYDCRYLGSPFDLACRRTRQLITRAFAAISWFRKGAKAKPELAVE